MQYRLPDVILLRVSAREVHVQHPIPPCKTYFLDDRLACLVFHHPRANVFLLIVRAGRIPLCGPLPLLAWPNWDTGLRIACIH